MPPHARTTMASAAGYQGSARCGGRSGWGRARGIDVQQDPGALSKGLWFVVADFDGRVRAWQFEQAARDGETTGPAGGANWWGPEPGSWASSLSREEYCAAVAAAQTRMASKEIEQVNIGRVLSAPWPTTAGPTVEQARGLSRVLTTGNPAPFHGHVAVHGDGVCRTWVVGASPELYLRIADGRVTSTPIKGTASTAAGLLAKDTTENLLVTRLVADELRRISVPGTVTVPTALEVQQHPGLVHLVSTVSGTLRDDLSGSAAWGRLFTQLFPPASVTGVPRSAALQTIRELEPVPRGPYCGCYGWVDGDERSAELAVGIRTFWAERGAGEAWSLRFGTGAGITAASVPEREWEETELKAARLVRLASRASSSAPSEGDVLDGAP